MANNNGSNFRNNNSFNRPNSYNNNKRTPYTRESDPSNEPPKAEVLGENYVDLAEQCLYEMHNTKTNQITTSKLRNILTMVSDIYNAENQRTEDMLTESSLAKIQLLRIRVVYECGRNPQDVKPFVIKTKILNYLLDIGNDRRKFIRYAHYMEALVAYHRFYGGKN